MAERGDELLTVEEIAARVKVTPETVRRWLRTRRLRGMRLSDKAGWRVRASELERFLDSLEAGDGDQGEEGAPKTAEAA
jgi:excisionase family DNA binding protein